MTCDEAGGMILEGDAHELEGAGEGPLAAHIRDCPRCRGMARAVLDGENALAKEMARLVPMPDLNRLLQEAKASEEEKGEVTPLRKRGRRLGMSLFPIAAAAAAAGLLFLTEPQTPFDPYFPPESTLGLGLEVPEGQTVAVLATNNPSITVLWFF